MSLTAQITPPARAAERSRDALARGLLEAFAAHEASAAYLQAVVALLRTWAGCEAAGVRVLDAHGEIPYGAMAGFDPEAWASENRLQLLREECLCTRVVQGRLASADGPLATPGGGVHAANVGAFLQALPPGDRACYRGRCHAAGFATLVVTPVVAGGRTMGALHLADGRPGLLDAPALAALEACSGLVGQALRRYEAVEALERSHRAERGLGALRSAALSAADEAGLLDAALVTLEGDGPVPVSGASIALHEVGLVRALGRSGRCQGCANRRCPGPGQAPREAPEFDTRGPAGRGGTTYAVPIRSPQGAVLGVLRACSPLERHDDDGARFLAAAAGILGGAVEARRTQAALRESEERLALALDGDDSGVFDLSVDGDLLHLSGAFGRMLRRSAPRLGDELLALVHPDDRERLKAVLHAHLAGEVGQLDVEARFEVAGGAWRWIHVRGRQIAAGAGVPQRVAGTFRDITEARRLQEHLAVSERLASVGTLAAGVAHEMNNPLSYVVSNVGFALEELRAALEGRGRGAAAVPVEQLGEVTEALREASHGAERVRRIVGGLRSLARVGDERTSADVREVLEAALEQVAGQIRSRGELRLDLQEVPRVFASPHRLAQVFLNLLTNAVQALPRGAPAEHEVAVGCALEGGQVRVRIRDTGAGMEEAVRSRIFEPFYTTRPVGEGTGLGLSVTHTIVRELGGRIEVESAPGRGSTFTVLLPPLRPA
ncbi:MAG: ATP-binding protein [Anaeromyxobacter sp.]